VGAAADRIAVRRPAVEQGRATREDLERLAQAWLRWADSEDGWFTIPHGEVLCRA
jgi:hypothetical protein